MGTLIGFMFAYCPFLIPIKKLLVNASAVSFPHPSPSYKDHILIIPRKVARNMFALSANDFVEIVSMAIKIREHDDRDYVLLINGGNRQDVMQAHFHLLTGNWITQNKLPGSRGQVLHHPDKDIWTSFVLGPHKLLSEYGVSGEAFSVVIQFEKNALPTFYVI